VWMEGGARVEALAVRAGVVLGVAGDSGLALRVGSRVLRTGDTLAEAGVGEGGAVEVWVGEGGGMLGALDALQEQMAGFVSALELAAQHGQASAPPVHPELEHPELEEALRALDHRAREVGRLSMLRALS
jgi:hypothetical protein